MYMERRNNIRIPTEREMLHFISDRPFRSKALNLSNTGLFLGKCFEPYKRPTRKVQVEIPIPEASEIVWAAGEIVYDALSPSFHGLGIRFTGMASSHARLIGEFVEEMRVAILKRMMREIRLKKELALALPKIQAPPPPQRYERTLVGYAPAG